jgi:hypothetical protein
MHVVWKQLLPGECGRINKCMPIHPHSKQEKLSCAASRNCLLLHQVPLQIDQSPVQWHDSVMIIPKHSELTSRRDSARLSIIKVELHRTFISRSSWSSGMLWRIWISLKVPLRWADEHAFISSSQMRTLWELNQENRPSRRLHGQGQPHHAQKLQGLQGVHHHQV